MLQSILKVSDSVAYVSVCQNFIIILVNDVSVTVYLSVYSSQSYRCHYLLLFPTSSRHEARHS